MTSLKQCDVPASERSMCNSNETYNPRLKNKNKQTKCRNKRKKKLRFFLIQISATIFKKLYITF